MCPLQTEDVVYLVYSRNNELEHNVAYLYEFLHEKQDINNLLRLIKKMYSSWLKIPKF